MKGNPYASSNSAHQDNFIPQNLAQVTWPNDNKAIGTCFPALIAGLLPVVSILARRIAFPLLFLGAGLVLVQPCAGAPFHFEADRQPRHRTRSVTRRRCCPTARCSSQAVRRQRPRLASAELYDPASGTWTATGSLATARTGHTATLLPNGKVLVAGGVWRHWRSRERGTLRSGERDLDGHRQPRHRTRWSHGDVAAQRQGARRRRYWHGGYLASAELYDPASGTWTATGSLATARSSHTATLLPNGKVLVAGGIDSVIALASAELYDPASGTWTATGSLATAR